jgi:hypothetical protein
MIIATLMLLLQCTLDDRLIMQKALDKVRTAIENGSVEFSETFILTLPESSEHSNHPVGKVRHFLS